MRIVFGLAVLAALTTATAAKAMAVPQAPAPSTRTFTERSAEPPCCRLRFVGGGLSRNKPSPGCGESLGPQLAPVMMPDPPLLCAAAWACCASNMAWKLTSVSRMGGKPARVQTSDTMARR